MRTIWIIWHWEAGRKKWMLNNIAPDVAAARKYLHPDFSEMCAAGHMRPMPRRVPRGFDTVIEADDYFGGVRVWRIPANRRLITTITLPRGD